ncbi:MAG: addiction module protein [Planctomycetes bacterium]|nr:addiction module protein [Planctomycetota bacterium]
MHGLQEIIDEASSLPVEERIIVIDSLMRTLKKIDPESEKKWIEVIKRRRDEIRTGKVKPLPGEEVLSEIRKRFEE